MPRSGTPRNAQNCTQITPKLHWPNAKRPLHPKAEGLRIRQLRRSL